MRFSHLKKLSLLLLLVLLCFLWNSERSIAGITANGNQGVATTAYTNSTANVPIYIWCTSPTSLTPASLTATPTTAGTYTFQWYKHNATTFQWASYAAASGTSSTISNLTNGGYKVEVKNGATTVECFHVWVWNFAAATTLGKTGACSNISLTNTITADTFVYYNPPAPPSLINSTTQINVCFSATHTWVSDLGFYLVGPTSCGSPIITLSPNPGTNCNSGNDVSNLCFSSTSTSTFNVCTASTPLTGTYGKYGAFGTNISWSSLNGCDASAGGWKVQIFDCVGLDFGSLTSASVTFSNLTSVCGSPTSITHASGPINSAINDNSCNTTTASTFSVPSPFSLPIKLGAGRSFQWSATSGATNFTTPNAKNSTAVAASGIDTMVATTTFMIGTASCTKVAKVVHINPTPIATTAILNDTICSADTAHITMSSNMPTATYSWAVTQVGVIGATAGIGNNLHQKLTCTGATSGYVIYTITPSNAGCVGSVLIDTIVVHPNPSISSAPIKQVLCSGDTTSFVLSSNVAGTSFTWVANPTGVSGTSSGIGDTIAQSLTTSTSVSGQAIYTIQASANGCSSNTVVDTAIVHPNPVISSAPMKQVLCSGDTTSFVLSSNVAGTSFTWVANPTGVSGTSSGIGDTIAQSLTTSTSVSGQAIYTIQASANGCSSNTVVDTAIVHPNPVISSAPMKQVLCSGDTTSFVLSSNVAGTSFTWVANPTGVSGTSSGIGDTIAQSLTTTASISGQVLYTIQALANGCSSNTVVDTAIVHPNPVISSAPMKQVLCSGDTTSFILSSNVAGTSFTWVANPTGVSGTSSGVGDTIAQSLTTTASISGQVLYTIQASVNGCSSNTVVDTVIVHPTKSSILTVTICQGQSYTFNGVTYTTNNTTAKDTIPSATTCDSVITLNLTVNPYIQATRTVTICQGQSYTFNGVTYTTNNTTAKDTIPSATTCDSVITLNLTVNPYIQATRTVTICQGQSYVFNGVTYTTNNTTAKDTIPSATTCDSVITLNLTVNPYIQATRTVTICQGQSYSFNGIVYTTNNTTAKDTISSATTCDSVITLNLTVNPYIQATRTVTICQGQSFMFNGTTYNYSTQSPMDTILSPSGCDSIINLHLSVLPAYKTIQQATICYGQSYSFNGISYTTNNNMAQDTFVTVNGCDSLVTLNLTVSLPPTSQSIDTFSCGAITINGVRYFQNTTVQDTLRNASGCDSIYRYIAITIHPSYAYTQTWDTVACDSFYFEGKTYYSNIQINDTLKTLMGCDSVYRTIKITIDNFQLELRSDLDLPYAGELLNLNTFSNQPYYQVLYWSPASLFPYQDKKSQYTKLHAPTTITVGAMSNSGCKDSASLSFQVLGLDYTVLFPNAFTPNGDGRNDVFRPLLNIKRGFQVKYFRILNRWGFEVFHQISQLLEGWDGRYQGVPQDNGVYFYYFEIEFADGHKVQMKGDVTLIR